MKSLRRLTTAAVASATVVVVSVAASAPAALGPPSGSDLVAIDPVRLVETRPAADGTFDGESFGDGRLAAGQTYSFRATRSFVSEDITAIALNVTAVNPGAKGFMTVFPCPETGSSAPTASNLNYVAGQTVANAAIVQVPASGLVCVFTSAASHLVVDAAGYVPLGGSPIAFSPARLVETRSTASVGTVDGQSFGDGPLAAGEVRAFVAAGRSDVLADAAGVVLNVTSVRPSSKGFLTVFPCPAGTPTAADAPTASNLNFEAGQNVAGAAIVQIGSGGRVCVYSSAPTDLIVDAGGYIPDGSDPTTFSPVRLVETRPTASVGTVDGQSFGIGPSEPGDVLAFQVAGRGGVVPDAAAVILNVTAVRPASKGFLTVFPCPVAFDSSSVPNASNVNFTAGSNVANSVVVHVGDLGRVCVYASAATDLVVDASGYVPAPPTAVTDTSVAPSTTVAPGAAATSGAWASIGDGSLSIARWDPCSTITFRIDPGNADDTHITAMFDAMATIEQATGLDFVFVGTYDAAYSFYSDNGTPGNASDDVYVPALPADAEVGITFTDASTVGAFDYGLLGFSLPEYTSTGELVVGTVTVDSGLDGAFDPYLVWLHEFGHLVGLAHVNSSGELMQAFYDFGISGLGPGDLEGLWNVGSAQPCFTAFSARPTERTRTFLPLDAG